VRTGGLTTLTKAKLVLALAGVALFGAGVRFEMSGLRWAGVAAVFVAWVLRFVRRDSEEETGT
jgi:hypothetical protein